MRGKGQAFNSKDPSTGEIIWEGNNCTAEDIEEVADQARLSFEHWSSKSFEERQNFIISFKKKLDERTDSIAELISRETGKPKWESLQEVKLVSSRVDLAIEAYLDRCPESLHAERNKRLAVKHKPHGIIAVFGPFNFPAHLPFQHILPAILAGNTVIFKPSEYTPSTSQELIKVWEESGIPSGVLNLVQGGKETGKALASNQLINGLFFTGSTSAGISLSQLFSSQPGKILTLEMGGNNPLIVSTVGDAAAAAYTAVLSAFLTAGQRCTCARRLIIIRGSKSDEFLETFASMAERIKIGRYTELPEPFMGPVISEEQALRLLAEQEQLTSKGAKSILPMRHIKKGTGFVTPGVIDVSAVADRRDKEIFGPFLQVIKVNGLDEAVKEANRTSYGLTAGIITDSEEEWEQFYKKGRAGLLYWNTPITEVNRAAPFGGVGLSGNLRPTAGYAPDYCSYPVSCIETSALRMPENPVPGIFHSVNLH